MKTKVLIVDDSAYTRQTMKKILEEEPALEVVGIATDGIDAMAKTLRLQPDIITLDFEMPGMDGFSFLRWLMRERPTPVIMVTSHADSKTVFKALELGAVDFIAKPTRRASVELETIERDLLKKIKGLKNIRLDILSKNLELLDQEEEEEQEVAGADRGRTSRNAVEIVAVGSSTGGPAALQIILTRLPADFRAAMVISQHMPKGFTGPLAERLDRMSQVKIKEAAEGDIITAGTVYICPGGEHLSLKNRGNKKQVALKEGRFEDKYIPSVDHMMSSVAEQYGAACLGVILTGMGNDGKHGMLDIKKQGGYTIAESEETAVVFGMPGEAIKNGGVEKILPLTEISAEIIRIVNTPSVRGRN
ncbi:MAG: chemotaxis response regulator protein-glutamate methylesterase [Nitrospirae bacterium]|nr:chemotaxis response regulator protein-glutamate methylesterase [Nitrospirota bacterium]